MTLFPLVHKVFILASKWKRNIDRILHASATRNTRHYQVTRHRKVGEDAVEETEEKTMEKADFQGKNMTCNDALSFCLFILFLSFPLEFFVIVVFKPDGDIFGNLPF